MPIVLIDDQKCTGCGICDDACPIDVIYMDHETRKAYIRYQKECQSCYLCVYYCPVDCIDVTPDRTLPVPAVY